MRKLSKSKAHLIVVKDSIAYGYRNGNSLRFLAAVYNTSLGSIRNLLIEEGVQMRKPGRKLKEN